MELTDKLKHLEDNILILKDIKKTLTKESLASNKRYEWEIRYGLLESIQIVIDISCKIVSQYNLGNPKSYKECIQLLSQYNFLEKDLSLKIESMVGLRNLLVHEYAEIDNNKLYDFLNLLDHFISFAKEIKINLK